jgi:hypothetical protein
MIELENRWIGLEAMWYEHYAIGVYPKFTLSFSYG